MAGFDPAEVEFRIVVDLTWALLMEVYREYGMKFEDAYSELQKQLGDQPPAAVQQKRTQDDASSMAMLQALMKDSDFAGPRG